MNYPALAGLTLDDRIYRNEEMGTVESMVPSGPFATCHSPAMLELPNGDMLCCSSGKSNQLKGIRRSTRGFGWLSRGRFASAALAGK